eukprot:6182353-Pleurochrysis_carterae.AAC.1
MLKTVLREKLKEQSLVVACKWTAAWETGTWRPARKRELERKRLQKMETDDVRRWSKVTDSIEGGRGNKGRCAARACFRLIDGIVSCQGFPHEEDQVGVIHVHLRRTSAREGRERKELRINMMATERAWAMS